MDTVKSYDVESAIDSGIDSYFADCHQRVDGFITKHFRWPGAWHTNKSALSFDLIRAPFNLFWAPAYVLCLIFAWISKRVGLQGLGNLLDKTPSGFTTKVQHNVTQLIYTDLLLYDRQQDPIKKHILVSLDHLLGTAHNSEVVVYQLNPVVSDALKHYGVTRTASADITNSLLSTIVGAFAFQKFTPGGLAIGFILASWFARKLAVDNFWAGSFFGDMYYTLFPPSPSPALQAASIALVLICLAVFASFSGLITDPIQSWTGLHRHRLHKLLKHLHLDVKRKSRGSFRPKDHFVARILEILDAAKSQII